MRALPISLTLAVVALLGACGTIDASRPGCRDGSTYRADILPMLNGQCPTRADERAASDYEIRTWEIDCHGDCLAARRLRGFGMLLNQPPRPAIAAPVKPPRFLPVPFEYPKGAARAR